MKKVIIYASNKGFAEEIAKQISTKMKIDETHDVLEFDLSNLSQFDKIVLVVSTHAEGEIQKDFAAQIDAFKALDLSGKTVALVGLGDGVGHGETFNNAQGQLYDMAKEQGATLVGNSDPSSYNYESTDSIRDGKFPGLVIDVDNQSDLTEARIEAWLKEVAPHF